MTNLKEKVMHMDFSHIAKLFAAAAIIAVALCAGANYLILQPQRQDMQTVRDHWTQSAQDAQKEYGLTNEQALQQALNELVNDGYKSGSGISQQGTNVLVARYKEQLTPISSTSHTLLAVTTGIVCAVFAAYWLLTAAWLYQAAECSKMSGWAWAVSGFFFNLFAAAAFLLRRARTRVKCPACHAWEEKGGYCAECGAALKR